MVWYRDARVLRVVVQVVAALTVAGILFWLLNNLVSNLNRLNINTDFGFLGRPTQFQIPFDEGFDPRSPVWQMVVVGVKNTFLAGFFGIVLASILGLIVGISRLSSNWLVARIATVYVETLRNIPPLVVIIFFGFALFTFGPFPVVSEAQQISFFGSENNFLILSNTVWGFPSLTAGEGAGIFGLLVAVGVAVSIGVVRWRTRFTDRTGRPHRRVRFGLGTMAVFVVGGFVVGGDVFSWSWPTLSPSARRIIGGFEMNYGFISVTVALGLYTASHIAEIVRGSILSVPKGQTEAANAIALNTFQRYRFVVLPQAFKVAVPPFINQCLNLVKNTSLGVAVAYAEITALTLTSIGNGRPAPQSIVILMGVYLAFSLTISVILNVYNRRLQVVER